MRIFFSVGEPSGDLHGANLIRELRRQAPGIHCAGFGGPKMRAAGCELHADLTQLAVMWVWQVLKNLTRFRALLRQAEAAFDAERPDAVVLIDYPGFNWHVARAAQERDIPVFYYGAPQMWAWAGWRIHKMRRLVNHVLCKLPFEARWYRERGCAATFVGHPYFDEMQHLALDEAFLARERARGGRLVAILPGSRTQEVKANLGTFLRAAERVRQADPSARFAVASFNERQAELAREQIARLDARVDVHVGRTQELISLAECCLACSGSVSLELLHHEKPTAILYQISPPAYFVQSFFRQVKYITLVNLLASDELYPADRSPYRPDQPDADRVPMPEYLAWRDCSRQLASHVLQWLHEPDRRAQTVQLLRAVREKIDRPGASQRAAEYILHHLLPARRAISREAA